MLFDPELHKPFTKGKNKYRQDELCLYYNYNSNDWELLFNGSEVISGKGSFELSKKFNELVKDFQEKEYIICFVNDLRLAMHMFPGGEVKGQKTSADLTKHPVHYITKHIEFRNFSLFHISAGGKGCVCSSQMYDYLRSIAKRIGRYSINFCDYTIGYMTKKILSYGKEQDILNWYGANHNYVGTVKEYEDQLIGNKTGLLKAVKGIHDDCLLIDIKSAYISSFVQLDCFPIGRKKHYTGKRALLKFLKDEYYHIIIHKKEIVEEFENHMHGDKYGFFKHDFLTFPHLKKWVLDQYKSGCEIEIYDSQRYGRLPKFYVDEIMNLYNYKQKATGSEKSAVKAITEMIYGKALQQKEFESDRKAYIYFLRPENFMRPEYSMIACSYVRSRLAEMIHKLGGSYYNDTDGIECAYSEENEQIVLKENERIFNLNKELGYESNIGTWEIEEKHARINIIGRKQRMYIGDNGELTVKVAGINKIYIEEHIADKDIKDILEYFSKPVSLKCEPVLMHVKGYGFIERERRIIILGGANQECQQKQKEDTLKLIHYLQNIQGQDTITYSEEEELEKHSQQSKNASKTSSMGRECLLM